MSGLDARHPDDLAYPRQVAATAGFSLGIPRNAAIAPDGSRVAFLRSGAPEDRVNALWVIDLASREERLVFDPHEHHPETTSEDLSPVERARRERVRERATGVVAFAHDRGLTRVTFVERGRLYVVDLATGVADELAVDGTPDDPRLDPAGTRVAYVLGGALHFRDLADGSDRALAADDDPNVTWGIADFAAAEEMRRMRGYWWSPDGAMIAVARVDESPVETWWISDPTDPAAAPYPVRYPRTGTANPLVTLHLVDVASRERIDVAWDEPERFEYLARVHWQGEAPLTLLVQSRDQRETRLLEVDRATGATTVVRVETDPAWIELLEGSPSRLDDGTLVSTTDAGEARRVVLGDDLATPATLHVDAIGAGEVAWVRAWEGDPTEGHVYRVAPGVAPVRVTDRPGDHHVVAAGGPVVIRSYGEHDQHPHVWVRLPGGDRVDLASHTEEPVVDPRPTYAVLGELELRAALLLPGGRELDEPLPVLMSPYGGPGAAEVVRWRGAYREQQWFADRLGVAVLVIDGRGTPGRSRSWEKAIDRNFALTLTDQVMGLQAAARQWPFLDLERVAMRGWSFGGWLSAMAVLTRPDVFHAAIAGAPVTDFRLYDTHYTERYLGTPQDEPEAYLRDAPLTHAASLTRPLLLIHGLADDNVVVANTLQLSAALFAHGIPHELELLPKASHIGGSGELVVARHLAELDFLRTWLRSGR